MSKHMIRKQIYLLRRHNLTLKRLAKQRGISEAEVIRQALEREAALSVPGVHDSRQGLEKILLMLNHCANGLNLCKVNPISSTVMSFMRKEKVAGLSRRGSRNVIHSAGYQRARVRLRCAPVILTRESAGNYLEG